uniref:Patatin n=1 Tax=Oryza glumipatula TaxID=40148 RepID=A0A0D9ZAX5_9ORYZ
MASSPMAMDADKLSYEIFSLLESKFLFGAGGGGCLSSGPCTPARPFLGGGGGMDGRVRVLAIDGCGSSGAGDALLAAAALARLEAGLRKRTGDSDAHVADFFDVAAGAGAGGVLAAMLFLRGPDGRPRYTAEEALEFVAASVGRDWAGRRGRWARLFRGGARGAERSFRRVFGDATLKDTVAPLLVPCYDLATAAPFMFSRADAVESDSYDFALRDVCAATCAAGSTAAAIRSVDGRTAIAAASGGVAAMGNPAAAAITHVLHNKQEFPLAITVDDILVLSIGTGASTSATATPMPTRSPSPREMARVTAEGVADMVDESVAMAFGHTSGSSSNYVRIQASKAATALHGAAAAGAMLSQRNVESVLFRGRRMSERTNAEKVDAAAAEVVKEHERRRRSPLPNVVVKQVGTPRVSSATTASSGTARTAASTLASPASYGSRQ